MASRERRRTCAAAGRILHHQIGFECPLAFNGAASDDRSADSVLRSSRDWFDDVVALEYLDIRAGRPPADGRAIPTIVCWALSAGSS